MYSILVVDDEPIIREGLKHKIEWNKYGFEFIKEAKNGQEALNFALELNPDLIIADMKMPVMDGVKLIKALKQNNIKSKVITISAYSNFYYTQAAIKNGVFDYILKPIDTSELTEVIIKLKTILDKEKSNTKTVNNISSSELLIGKAKDQFLKNFSKSYILDKTNIVTKILDLDISLSCIEYYTNIIYSNKILNLDQIKNISKSITENLSWENTIFANPIYPNHIFMIWGNNNSKNSSFSILIEKLNNQLLKCIESNFTIVTGECITHFNEINRSFATALNTLNYRSIHAPTEIIFYEETKNISTKPISFSAEKENAFLLALEICDWNEISFNIDSLFNMIKGKEEITFRQVYKLCSELLFLCERLLRKYESHLDELFKNDITSIEFIATTGSLEKLKDWFAEVVFAIMNQIKLCKSNDIGKIIKDIQDFINKHYFEDISLSFFSKKYHLNNSYLSTIFKDFTGENLIEHLTSVRITKAASLLKTKKFKVNEVAKMVGYSDARYFSKRFKQYYGLLPTKFQKANHP